MSQHLKDSSKPLALPEVSSALSLSLAPVPGSDLAFDSSSKKNLPFLPSFSKEKLLKNKPVHLSPDSKSIKKLLKRQEINESFSPRKDVKVKTFYSTGKSEFWQGTPSSRHQFIRPPEKVQKLKAVLPPLPVKNEEDGERSVKVSQKKNKKLHSIDSLFSNPLLEELEKKHLADKQTVEAIRAEYRDCI